MDEEDVSGAFVFRRTATALCTPALSHSDRPDQAFPHQSAGRHLRFATVAVVVGYPSSASTVDFPE
jgi:hypothetical protein